MRKLASRTRDRYSIRQFKFKFWHGGRGRIRRPMQLERPAKAERRSLDMQGRGRSRQRGPDPRGAGAYQDPFVSRTLNFCCKRTRLHMARYSPLWVELLFLLYQYSKTIFWTSICTTVMLSLSSISIVKRPLQDEVPLTNMEDLDNTLSYEYIE